MSTLNFMRPVLDALGDGRVVRRVMGLALRVGAALIVIGGLVAFVAVIGLAFHLSAAGAFGGVLLGLLALGATFAVAQILMYRANSIDQLGESQFTVVPILSILFRTAGEAYATLGVLLGIGGCLFIWLAKTDPRQVMGAFGSVLPSSAGGNSFFGGIGFFVVSVVISFLVLLISYFLAESTLLIADIARNTDELVRHEQHRPVAG